MRTKHANRWRLCLPAVLFLICTALAVSFSVVRANAAESIEFSIDTLGFGRSELPDGYAGKSYPVFAYTATNGEGQRVTDTQVTVFDPAGNILPIKNGRFDTETTGKYTIEYTAWMGDVTASKTLLIEVLSADRYSAPSYTINDEIVSAADTGSLILLPEGTVNGENVTVNLSVTYTDGEYPCQPQIGEGTETAYFVPVTEGTYSLVYTLTDFVGGSAEAKKEITVSDSDLPILRVPSVSKVAHAGMESKYPVAGAVLYRDGKQIYVPVKMSVGDQDITQTMAYTPDKAGEYTVTYTAANIYDTTQIARFEQRVTVYGEAEENAMYAARYFSFDNMKLSYRSESEKLESFVAVLSAVSGGDLSSFDFKTSIPEEYLSVSLGADGQDSSFGSLQICFRDSKYDDEQICVVLKENADKKIDVFLNGRKVKEWDKTFTGETNEYSQSSFTVQYDAASKSLVDENGDRIASISSYMNGKVFRGFTSKSGYVSVAMNNVTAGSKIKLYRIAEQAISDAPADTLDPVLIYRDGYRSTQNADIGETITVGYMEAFDLFDTAPTLTATIKSPSGKEIYSGDIDSNFSFTADEYGVYSVEYIARDSAGREKNIRAVVQVIDRIAPEIVVKQHLKEVEKDKEYTFSAADVTDNYSTEITSWISVAYEDSSEEFIPDGKYVFRETGRYIITYGAMDAAGNRTLVSYTVECK